jgi:hypothetical protein
MQSIINKIKENIVDRIVEVFWVAVKAAVIAAIILLLLQIVPISVRVGVRQVDRTWNVRVDQLGTWGVDNFNH